MAGIRETKKQQTRQAILQAAIRLFGEQGYDATSVEDLARAAGVGKATVYGYFQDKKAIFLAFCEMEIDHVFTVLAQQQDPDAPLLDQLMTLFLAQFRFVTENREFGRQLIREAAFPPAAASDRSRELDARYLGAIDAILQRAQQRGELRLDCDRFLTTAHFYALYLLALSGWYTGYVHTIEEVEASLAVLFRQALEGVAAAGASAPKSEAAW